jgi:hypothetical protein
LAILTNVNRENRELVITAENVELSAGAVGNLAPGAYVGVSLSDAGFGMRPAVAARAFAFLYGQGCRQGKRLGLSQVYGFIAQSGGDVVIDSEEGKGTTISMYLPVIEGTSDDAIVAANDGLDTVLIVKDEAGVLDAGGAPFPQHRLRGRDDNQRGRIDGHPGAANRHRPPVYRRSYMAADAHVGRQSNHQPEWSSGDSSGFRRFPH